LEENGIIIIKLMILGFLDFPGRMSFIGIISSELSLDVLMKLSEFFAILESSNLACLDLEESEGR